MPKLFLLLALLAGSSVMAATDISDSRDPLGLKRFPHSWIVAYERDDELLPREFVISSVDKTRREVHVERKVRTDATLESATYQMPDGTPRQEVVDHYIALLGGETLFRCEGLDCGGSNIWANYVFKQYTLYGPDRNQSYLAVKFQGHLVGVYVVERGNKRVYAHLLVLTPARPVPVTANQDLTERLAANGFVVVDGATPLMDGALPDATQRVLQEVGRQLSIFAGQRIYVVCHIYGPAGADELLAAANRCSTDAVGLLGRAGGVELVPFGAGPLLPRSSRSVSRIELVLPHGTQNH